MTILENDILKVSISEHGAELIGVLDKRSGKEDLWQADPKVWGRHAPILFPFVGKVNGNEYRYAGKTYKMGQHGFARDMDFELLKSEHGTASTSLNVSTCTYVLKDSPESREKYPFAFELRISYELKDNVLGIVWDIRNPAAETMYFSIGGHPAFQAQTGYFVTFQGAEELEYCLLDPESGCVDVEHPLVLDMPDGYLEMTPELFAKDALIFDHAQIAQATLCYPDKRPFVTIDCAGFPSFGLWCQKADSVPFVCLEPWMGRADNKNFAGELPEKYEEQNLEPGGRFTVKYQLTFD